MIGPMTTHIGAEPGQIAPRILLPGDPLRARWVAETYLTDAVCFNEVRGMYGFTGTYQGEQVSVMGTGMGIPSISIYATELMQDFGVQQLVRVGSCGAVSEKLKIRDVVVAQAAATDSSANNLRFSGCDYPATADFGLLRSAVDASESAGASTVVGTVFSSDSFYSDRPDILQTMTGYGVLAVEMEAHALFTLAAKYDRQALAICTVSDHIVTGEQTTATERQETFGDMIEIGLAATLRTPLP